MKKFCKQTLSQHGRAKSVIHHKFSDLYKMQRKTVDFMYEIYEIDKLYAYEKNVEEDSPALRIA